MSQLRTPSPDPVRISDAEDTESEDDIMFVALAEIPTLIQMFKKGFITAVDKPRFPVDASLLNRISLLFVQYD